MPDFWKRVRAPIAFGLLCLVTAVTMVLDRPLDEARGDDLPWWQGWLFEIAVPIQKLVTVPVDKLRGAWRSYVDVLELSDQNARLRARVIELEEANLQYREALVASGNLQRVAAMRDDFEIPMMPSEIVGLDVSPWFRSVLIDRGGRHGVRPGFPVITDRGVVGLVTATSGHAAKTMLLLDRQSAIDGIVQRTRARGIVRGLGSDELEFEFVVRGSDVREGDVVITSGMGGVYPKGLRIGRVSEVVDPEGQLLQTAILQPAVDFGRLEQVFVMLRRGPAMDLLYGGNGETEAIPANGGQEGEAPASEGGPALMAASDGATS